MSITRRRVLWLAGSTWLSRVFAASLPNLTTREPFEVDRLLNSSAAERGLAAGRLALRKYVASATVTLFSIPIVSKNSVGSGYAVIEESGRALSLQFGAGSYPESARGLNRLGYIQEAVIEERIGNPVECAWLAFMTTSQEKNLDQAKKALESSGNMVAYTASQGYGRNGSFAAHVDRLEFPGRYTWRDVAPLFGKAREAMAAGACEEQRPFTGHDAAQPATFLYRVHRAMLDASTHTTSCLVFNKKQFQLDTQKEPDATASAYFAGKNLVPPSGVVMRMKATLTEMRTGEKTPFRLWFESGDASCPPLRFDYQAKPFLRLTFEVDAGAITPPVRFAFQTSKEAV